MLSQDLIRGMTAPVPPGHETHGKKISWGEIKSCCCVGRGVRQSWRREVQINLGVCVCELGCVAPTKAPRCRRLVGGLGRDLGPQHRPSALLVARKHVGMRLQRRGPGK